LLGKVLIKGTNSQMMLCVDDEIQPDGPVMLPTVTNSKEEPQLESE